VFWVVAIVPPPARRLYFVLRNSGRKVMYAASRTLRAKSFRKPKSALTEFGVVWGPMECKLRD
jgi:hypothetical protein